MIYLQLEFEVSLSKPQIKLRWSSGQDIAFSRRDHGFESRTEYYLMCFPEVFRTSNDSKTFGSTRY